MMKLEKLSTLHIHTYAYPSLNLKRVKIVFFCHNLVSPLIHQLVRKVSKKYKQLRKALNNFHFFFTGVYLLKIQDNMILRDRQAFNFCDKKKKKCSANFHLKQNKNFSCRPQSTCTLSKYSFTTFKTLIVFNIFFTKYVSSVNLLYSTYCGKTKQYKKFPSQVVKQPGFQQSSVFGVSFVSNTGLCYFLFKLTLILKKTQIILSFQFTMAILVWFNYVWNKISVKWPL